MSFPIALLRDDFTDNTQSPAWAGAFVLGSGTKAETGGQVVLTLPNATAGTHAGAYTSSAAYDLTGDSFYWNIGTMVATGVAAQANFDLYLDSVNILRWRQLSNVITARTIVAGVDTQLFTAAWSSSTYKYLRIRESGGTIFWDSSTNGTSWTNRASVANPFAATSLYVQFSASCGNVASPGSLRLDDVNLILPTPSATWRETTADWSITNRLRSVTLASDGGKQGVIVTADTMDASRVLGGTVRYFAGPLGSSSGGYLQLTEYASLALAQGSPFVIPTDGRVDLPAMVDARYMRLYHRSLDASAHTIREFVPRRLVQADDIEAESIKAINISAGAITADKIFVLTLGAITANIGKLNIDTTGYLYQGTGSGDSPTTGLKIFNSGGIGKLSTYNTGVEQVTFDTDGKLKAGAGTVVLDATGVQIEAISSASYTTVSAIKWGNTANSANFGRMYGWYDNVASINHVNIESYRSGTTRPGAILLDTNGWNGGSSIAAVEIFGGSSGTGAYVRLNAPTTEVYYNLNVGVLSGGINVGTASGAGAGQIATSGNVALGANINSGMRLLIHGAGATNATYAIYAENSSNTQLFSVDNDGGVFAGRSGGKIGFLGATPVVRQLGGAVSAGATYTATEQAMLDRVYQMARTMGLLT